MLRPKPKYSKQGKSMLSEGMRFPTVAALLDFLPADERALTEQLRELIISEAPDLKERLSFNVPFYKGRRDVCFICLHRCYGARRRPMRGCASG